MAKDDTDFEDPDDLETEPEDLDEDAIDDELEAEPFEAEESFDDDEDFEDTDEESDSDGEEEDEALDELEAEELELLDEEESESLLVDEVAELRAIRREELTMNVEAKTQRSDEFVCQSCFLVKRTSQLANRRKMICYDCAS